MTQYESHLSTCVDFYPDEFMATAIKERSDASFYTDEQVAELTKQVKRVAKFLCVSN